MTILSRLQYTLNTVRTLRDRSSAGEDINLPALVRNYLPRFFSPGGYAFKPLSLFLIVNGVCNLRCRMCDVGQQNQDSMFYKNMVSGEFDFACLETLIRELRSFRPFISITSTEPLLYSRLHDAVTLVKDNGLKLNITTNGFLLEEHAGFFVRAGLDKISLSIDGPAEIHDDIRGVKGVYDRALRGIRKIHEAKKQLGVSTPRIMINSTICDLNVNHLDKLCASVPWDMIDHQNLMPMVFLTEKLASEHNANFGERYPATPTCLSGGIDPMQIDWEKILSTVSALKETYGSRLHLYFRNEREYLEDYFQKPELFLGSRNCLFPWFAAQISAKGDLLGLTRCYGASFGNVFENGFDAAWNGEAMRQFRRDLLKHGSFPACSRCEGVLIH